MENKECCTKCSVEINENHPNMCNVCLDNLCNEHSNICSECFDVVCDTHASICKMCNKVLCKKHDASCEECGELYCHECYEKSHCIKCGATGCNSCMNEVCVACSNLRKAEKEDLEKYGIKSYDNLSLEIGFNQNTVVLVENKMFGENRYVLNKEGKMLSIKETQGFNIVKFLKLNYKKYLLALVKTDAIRSE